MTEHNGEKRSRRLPRDQALVEVQAKRTVSLSTASSAVDISEQVVRRAVEAGEIRAVRIGRNWSVLTGPLREQFALDD